MPVQPKGSYGACPNPIWPAMWCYGGTRTQNLLHKTTWLEHYGGCKASTIKHHFLLGKMNYVYSLAAFGRFQGRENNLIGEITCHYMFCFIFCMTNQDY